LTPRSGRRGRGRFITFEGGEGAGKSSQVRLLAEQLETAGLEVVATREPGGAPGAEEIRRLLVHGAPGRWRPKTEALLHVAARCDHLDRVVLPALERGCWVISDRFADSTMAYQGYGQGLGPDWVAALNELVLGDFAPDLTIILDLPVEAGLARAAARGEGGEGGDDRYERMDKAFHRRLREGYKEIARRSPTRCVLVDASGDMAAVNALVRRAVADRLELQLP